MIPANSWALLKYCQCVFHYNDYHSLLKHSLHSRVLLKSVDVCKLKRMSYLALLGNEYSLMNSDLNKQSHVGLCAQHVGQNGQIDWVYQVGLADCGFEKMDVPETARPSTRFMRTIAMSTMNTVKRNLAAQVLSGLSTKFLE